MNIYCAFFLATLAGIAAQDTTAPTAIPDTTTPAADSDTTPAPTADPTMSPTTMPTFRDDGAGTDTTTAAPAPAPTFRDNGTGADTTTAATDPAPTSTGDAACPDCHDDPTTGKIGAYQKLACGCTGYVECITGHAAASAGGTVSHQTYCADIGLVYDATAGSCRWASRVSGECGTPGHLRVRKEEKDAAYA